MIKGTGIMMLIKFSRIFLLVLCFGSSASLALEAPDGDENIIYMNIGDGKIIDLPTEAIDLIVMNPDIVNIKPTKPKQILLSPMMIGQTEIIALDIKGNKVFSSTLIVAYKINKIRETLRQRFPGQNIEAFISDKSLVLRGEIADKKTLADVSKTIKEYTGKNGFINHIKVSRPPKVRLYVRLIEISHTAEEKFGVNWKAMFYNSHLTLLSGVPLASSKTSGSVGQLAHIKGGISTPFANMLDLNIAVDWLEKNGYASVLTEPNMSTITNETAKFRVGRQIPIPAATITTTGNQQSSSNGVNYQFFGLNIEFTPKIISKNNIRLMLNIESNDTSANSATVSGNDLPISSSQTFSTTLDLKNKQSFAVAGLFQKLSGDTVNKFPILADIPILGEFFKRKTLRDNQSELVVLITPYIVDDSEYALKLKETLRPLSNLEYIIISKAQRKEESEQSAVPRMLSQDMLRLSGPMGFMY